MCLYDPFIFVYYASDNLALIPCLEMNLQRFMIWTPLFLFKKYAVLHCRTLRITTLQI